MKYTTETFIKKANEIHNNKYDYSLIEYINTQTLINIVCPQHGIFKQIPANHIRNNKPRGCPNCAKNKKLTTETFIKKAKEVHSDKYDYSLVKYVNANTKIKIICPKHGVFEQKPFLHLQNYGCQICGNNIKLTTETFIKKAKEVHGDKYNYSLAKYVGSHLKIKIICPKHGVFEQKPNNHLCGQGCYRCGETIRSNIKFINANNSFLIKANKIHSNLYDYSLVQYKNNRSKIKIICSKHGVFEQKVNSHLSGHGCPECNISKGELKIKNILDEKNIEYAFQKTFDDCITPNNRKLKFDFYLPNQNILIEYDGKQHYVPLNYFGGIKSFNVRKEYDEIKNKFAKDNNITLLRIPYFKYKIIDKLIQKIIENKKDY